MEHFSKATYKTTVWKFSGLSKFANLVRPYQKSYKDVLHNHVRNFQNSLQGSYQNNFQGSYQNSFQDSYKISKLPRVYASWTLAYIYNHESQHCISMRKLSQYSKLENTSHFKVVPQIAKLYGHKMKDIV